MKKIISILLLVLVLGGASAFAYQNYSGEMRGNYYLDKPSQRGQFQDQMYQIIENGTYEDLVALREELGFDLMRRVDSQEDFEYMQQMHEQRKDQGFERGYKRSQRGSDLGFLCH